MSPTGVSTQWLSGYPYWTRVSLTSSTSFYSDSTPDKQTSNLNFIFQLDFPVSKMIWIFQISSQVSFFKFTINFWVSHQLLLSFIFGMMSPWESAYSVVVPIKMNFWLCLALIDRDFIKTYLSWEFQSEKNLPSVLFLTNSSSATRLN